MQPTSPSLRRPTAQLPTAPNGDKPDQVDALDFDWDIDYPPSDTFQDLFDAVKLQWHYNKPANFSSETRVELFEAHTGNKGEVIACHEVNDARLSVCIEEHCTPQADGINDKPQTAVLFVPLKSASSNASFGSRTALSLNGFQALVNGLKFDQTFALDLLG